MEPVAAIATFKNVWDLTKGLAKFSATTEFKDKIIELQGAIFTANERYSTLLEENDKLKSKVTKLKAWDSEKKKYELEKLKSGAFAYALKNPKKEGADEHYLCTSCYEKGKKSILQRFDQGMQGTSLGCFDCKLDIVEIRASFRGQIPKSF